MSRARGHRDYVSEEDVIFEDEVEEDALEEHGERTNGSNIRRASSPPLLDIDHGGNETGGFTEVTPSLGHGRNQFDFTPLDKWALQEKIDLGVTTVGENKPSGIAGIASNRSVDVQEIAGELLIDLKEDPSALPSHSVPRPVSFSASIPEDPPTLAPRRQRKASRSAPVSRRQGKLALFEGGGAGGTSTGVSSSTLSNLHPSSSFPRSSSGSFLPTSNSVSSQISNYSTSPQAHPPPLPTRRPTPMYDYQPHQERPYRFSFYSNALPATIHARDLSELPAEGQTFQDLFGGKGGLDGKSNHPAPPSGVATPRSFDSTKAHPAGSGLNVGQQSLLSRAVENARSSMGVGHGTPVGGEGMTPVTEDPEATTWWLDVLSPTDEEMRLLSKVSLVYCHVFFVR